MKMSKDVKEIEKKFPDLHQKFVDSVLGRDLYPIQVSWKFVK